MDIVTDLTAEAISYLTLFQDILKNNSQNNFPKEFVDRYSWKNLKKKSTNDYHLKKELTPAQIDEITDLVWHSPDKLDTKNLTEVYLDIIYNLLDWLGANIDKRYIDRPESRELLLFRVPFFWRQQIRAALYKGQLEERKKLAAILEYMPVQVIQAIAGRNKSPYEVRLYQFYVPRKSEDDYNKLLSDTDFKNHKIWWDKNKETAEEYLTNDNLLLRELLNDNVKSKIKREFTLPFETLFNDELNEIVKAREKRKKEWQASKNEYTDNNSVKISEKENKDDFDIKLSDNENNGDPMVRALDMKLYGLAFSGGGIRSATFNLGILQRLAGLGVLGKMDYISTVSGGGYIGTWYTSWIKRSGTSSKVTDQLCPEKSSDPFADEVRPIRWLRMFSNYLSPNVGLMSPDAWTSGMTWLRNTLVNQVLLLLVLLTVFSMILDLYNFWEFLGKIFKELKAKDEIRFLLWNSIMLSLGALIAAFAMRSYYKIKQKRKVVSDPKIWNVFDINIARLTSLTSYLPTALIIWTIFCAFLISTFMYNIGLDEICTRHEGIFIWFRNNVAFPSLFALVFVGMVGNYDKRHDLILLGKATVVKEKMSEKQKSEKKKIGVKRYIWFLTILIISSTFASIVLSLLLYLFWNYYSLILPSLTNFNDKVKIDPDKVMLLIGLPIVLQIFSLAIITRMAIMGRMFPDYRREWWGRTGGYVNRFILFWMLICFGVFIMPDLWRFFKEGAFIALPTWAGIVAWGVKKAFSSKDNSEPGNTKSIMNTVVKIVPFIFMIGVILIGSGIINQIRFKPDTFQNLIITVVLFLLTLFLSWRVGVNEFSLHHFYRNRLIRAFMGATRSREDRIKTANAFTGFDTDDDILLSSMLVEDGYSGPFPILNTALNATVVSALDRQDRKAESFVFTPLYCGYDFSPTRASTWDVDNVYEYGYRPTNKFSNKNGGPTIGTAMAISGAAVNPNWGYHSSAPMAFLLTIFNVRLGWWIGNTRRDRWKDSDPRFGLVYLIRDLIGKSDINKDYVCLSDGGHFDNMGLYELIRRRCNYIILGDGEQDQDVACEGLANAIRRCRIDFGVEIVFHNFEDITKLAEKSKKKHIIKGDIIYPGTKTRGTLIYIKATLTGDEPIDIREYALANPDFPQQSTADQFFDEAQFESYRKLGYHSIHDVSELHF
ncbi:patatin-like phospholipase family protein [Flavobacterium defluvii]|uniref:Patatin-like phospholipase n=1 Tax=Flavobacterium defluvii TaxID=370979 RepID=A0A1M5U0X2_9FLAO|nr:patatin-like phospholipase family protein [Flavobacterium defluvii]SHH56672.1 Patatin-like phospholipase [Flavobacterium defluvii]